MKNTGASLVDMQVYQMPNNTCTLCINPFNGKTLEKLPISNVHWRPQSSCSRNIVSSIMRSKVSLAYKEASIVENNWKLGLDIPIKTVTIHTALAGSHSRLAEFAESKTVTTNTAFSPTSSAVLSTDPSAFGLLARILPSLFSNSLIAIMRKTRNSTGAKYGTHYIVEAQVGGDCSEDLPSGHGRYEIG
ncbi:hypothetical protein XELAEV_18001562mg [Xenopus laevis]|nr:hypothetical protein XELAEV_18001562mg [Xenopus laevis]